MPYTVLNPEGITTLGLASSRFARRYFGNLFWFLFLRLLRCFSSAGIPTYYYFIHNRLPEYCSGGFPHSDICGSMLICSSPQLFAAYHVLLRLLMPRHSPCALIRLTSSKLARLLGRFRSLRLSSRLLLFPKNLVFKTRFPGSPTCLLPVSAGLWLSASRFFKTISRSPCDLIMWVSCFGFVYSQLPSYILYIRAFFLKKPVFSYSPLYSILKHQFNQCDGWKVDSRKVFVQLSLYRP